MRDHKIPDSHCPNCEKSLDGAFNTTDDSGPSPGDISICVMCGTVLEFGNDLHLIEAKKETLKRAAGDPAFMKAANAVGIMIRNRNGY